VVTLTQVGAALGRAPEALQELDRRPLPLAFLGGSYETVVVRDRTTGETLETTLGVENGEPVDAAELRRRDREVAEREGAALDARLRELLLRHPELPAIRVVVTRAAASERSPLQAGAGDIVAIARDPDVTRIELAEDPEVLD
jgi:hypothetical protein